MNGLTRENPSLIGFVTACLWNSAITNTELRAWCDHMVAKHEVDELPDYLFELSRFDDYPVKLTRIIGFETGWRGTKAQEHALVGITVLRGHDCYEWTVSPEKASAALAKHPEILSRFREVFPFISLPAA